VTIALLTLTGVLLAVAVVLTVRSIRRNSALDGFAAMMAVLCAGVPAAAYGALGV
jgi:hypothetical protein